MANHSLGMHETMEIHELLNFKTDCAMRSKALSGLATDGDLKTLLEEDIRQSVKAMTELQNILSIAQH